MCCECVLLLSIVHYVHLLDLSGCWTVGTCTFGVDACLWESCAWVRLSLLLARHHWQVVVHLRMLCMCNLCPSRSNSLFDSC